MTLFTMRRVTNLSLFLAMALAQSIFPSNSTTDLYPIATSPRFLLNGTEFPHLPVIRLAPLGEYAEIDHSSFLDISVSGHLVNVGASNANSETNFDQFSYMSCDPSAYTGNLNVDDVFRIVVDSPRANVVILYSETSDHCAAQGLNNLPTINGVLTTTDVMVASMLAKLNLNSGSSGDALILPDLNAYTTSTNGPGFETGSGLAQSPTTAVAMIILYSITGVITALFVVIIITGAIRAHRHPERYGPRNIIGRGRQSRARGIARAMLETLPIVKFGDRETATDRQKPPQPQSENRDIEMNPAASQPNQQADNGSAVPVATSMPQHDHTEHMSAEIPTSAPNNADGTDADGQLQCSICTEDFTKGEDIRVLPCNHKFHPDCVDPWLLNVSGTCPLCRIDLRPQGQEDLVRTGSMAGRAEGEMPPPLAGGVNEPGVGEEGRRRRDTFASLRQMANLGVGSREERIAALRRLRQERRTTPTTQLRHERRARLSRLGSRFNEDSEEETERNGLARRFRERFRIRTERNGNGNSEGR